MEMKKLMVIAPVLALLLAGCVKPVEVLQPVSAALQSGPKMISEVDVKLSSTAAAAMTKFEDKAREKRAAAGLPPIADGQDVAGTVDKAQYATLPFGEMFERVVTDVTREKGLSSGRPLKLAVEIDTLKTANAGMALLAGSNDQLAGSVKVHDAASGETLGEFYVDVINSHSGLLGLAMRGGGVREELAEEFALHISRQLNGKGKK
jgi:hypothetical protein